MGIINASCVDENKIFYARLDKQPGGPNGVSGDGSDRVMNARLIEGIKSVTFKQVSGSSLTTDGITLNTTFTHDNYNDNTHKFMCKCHCPDLSSGVQAKLLTVKTAAYYPKAETQKDTIICAPAEVDKVIPVRTSLGQAGYRNSLSGAENIYTPIAVIYTNKSIRVKTRWIAGSTAGAIISLNPEAILQNTLGGSVYTPVYGANLCIMAMSQATKSAIPSDTYLNTGPGFATPFQLGVTIELNGVESPEVILTFWDSCFKTSGSTVSNVTYPSQYVVHATVSQNYIIGGQLPGEMTNYNSSIGGMVNISCQCPEVYSAACAGTAYNDNPSVNGSWDGDSMNVTVTHTKIAPNRLSVFTYDLGTETPMCIYDALSVAKYENYAFTFRRKIPSSYFIPPGGANMLANGTHFVAPYEVKVIPGVTFSGL